MKSIKFTIVNSSENGMRLEKWFKHHYPDVGRARIHKLIRTGNIRLNGKKVKFGSRITEGEEIQVPQFWNNADSNLHTKSKPKPKRISKDINVDRLKARILKMDANIIALDKPAGLAVQGGTKVKNNLDDMLDDFRFDFDERPRLVHRLDKDTSGVLILARTRFVAQALTEAFKEHLIQKKYWAIVVGKPEKRRDTIQLALIKKRQGENEHVVSDPINGKDAKTCFQRIASKGNIASWLELRPLTGRTHQLRAHCALIGCPILGDGKYGGQNAFIDSIPHSKKVHLHAREIELVHPLIGKFSCRAPVPPHLTETFSMLGFDHRGRSV